jgi:hypothetical protein
MLEVAGVLEMLVEVALVALEEEELEAQELLPLVLLI